MQTPRAALAAQAFLADEQAPPQLDGHVIDLEDVAARRERLLAYAQATRAVIVYRFVFPPGASVPGLGRDGEFRDAGDQLHLVVGLTGGAITCSLGGLAARIPKALAAKFEAMAGSLIERWLVALDIGEDAI